jgi:hypothetical protein
MKGFQSIGEGMCSIFSWILPSKSYKELSKEIDEKIQDLYDKQGWGEYHNPINQWHFTKFTTELPNPQIAKTPIRDPARKVNRR